jgi:magnesium-transporting ATPase (P-type)
MDLLRWPSPREHAPPAGLTVLHSSPGRMRISLPSAALSELMRPGGSLADAPGVTRIEVGLLTGNALILFDPNRTDSRAILTALGDAVSPASPPAPDLPSLVHSSPGRMRIAQPRRPRKELAAAEARVRSLPGVTSLRPSRLTGNVLVTFDPARVTGEAVFTTLRTAFLSAGAGEERPDGSSLATGQPHSPAQMRIPLPGLDRIPRLGRRAVERLERRFGARAWTKRLTGHLLVEYDEHRVALEDLLAEIAHLQLPALPGEDRPAHPLDPEPLAEGVVRTLGSLVGIAALTFRRLTAGQAAQRQGVAALAASFINLIQGFPFVRDWLRRRLGRHNAGLLAHSLYVAIQAFADFPLGLILSMVEAVAFLNEVTARRAAWRRYEEGLDGAASAEYGSVVRLEAGMRVPLGASVLEGSGSATGQSGLPTILSPGAVVPAGAILSGGPFVLELLEGQAFEAAPRPAPPLPTVQDRYIRIAAPLSVGYAGFTFLRTASFFRALEAMLLLNPRTAVIGQEAANLLAASRCLRAGITVVGTRPNRSLCLPDVLLLDGPRILANGLEVAGVHASAPGMDQPGVLGLAADISLAAGSPWGAAFPAGLGVPARDGDFNGLWASATLANVRYTLGPPEDAFDVPDGFLDQHLGGYLLEVRMLDPLRTEELSLGFVALRPRLAPGVDHLVSTCRRFGVAIELLPGGFVTAGRAIARRTGVLLGPPDNSVQAVRRRQQWGGVVAFVSDHADAAPAFEACDLAVALSSGRREFPARADLLAPDLRALADLLDAGTRRRQAVLDSVLLGAGANAVGTVLGLLAPLGPEKASLAVYLAALAAMGSSWLRLRGGARPGSTLAHLSDPRPERWGRWLVVDILRALNTSTDGLTSKEAASRRAPQDARGASGADELLNALRNQLRAPITTVLAGGACLTVLLGQPLNTALLGLTISLNLAVGVWEERQVGRAAEALEQLSAATARVLRDGEVVALPAVEVVPGDILVLAAGQRVAADACLIAGSSLEVAEAALTGESLPVVKSPDEGGKASFSPVQETGSGRIVLEGSDVIAGAARAVVVAVGRQTRLGATAAALNIDADEESPLGARLGQILHLALPVAGVGGLVTGLAGLAWGGAPAAMLTLGVTTALSAIPEGLPLLAGVGQAGVARRLASRSALVRRIAAIEALGRIDVACTDKTGTLTEGRLSLCLLGTGEEESPFPGPLSPDCRELLLAAALASPHPDAEGAGVHTTDAAVLRAAVSAGLGPDARAPRLREVPFDSARAFSCSALAGRVCVKGAPERLAPRCVRLGRAGRPRSSRLDAAGRTALLERVAELAARGLRILLVAEGPPDVNPEDPRRLTALGFIGISDPLRGTVPGAVRRCLLAGVRVLMLTGDHPSTARAIAREAGLFIPGHDAVLRAAEVMDLPPEELDRRLEGVAVVSRATPLDKLRIIESLQRRQRAVAMTGDGVNDAPSLRLADVGVAMGRSGTEVARQAADVVLIDDDFSSLVEALVEGRGFWRNMRKGLSLLLGGNAGELGLIAGASLLGFGAPLSPVHILIVNMITDALPSLAVLLQRPEHRNLAGLAREGLSALDSVLRRDVFRRGVATGLPSLAAFLLARGLGGPVQGSAVGFTSIISTQLAQTLEAGRVEGTLSRSVAGAVTVSAGMLLSVLLLPPLRNFLGLVAPNAVGWGLVGGASASAVALSRLIEFGWRPGASTPDWTREFREKVARELEQRARARTGAGGKGS